MKRYLPFVIVALVAVLAVGGGAVLYRSKRSAGETPTVRLQRTGSEAESTHVLGPADASVTVEEFGDFQCPPCGKLSEPINQLQKEFNLRVIYREFPLAMHTHAREAACAAEAASHQGKFWEMHDLLYREQAVWSKSDDARALFNAYAGMLQLDVERFKKDIDSSDVQQQVELDQRRGANIGVRNTPTIFINNEVLAANHINAADLRTAVEAAVKNVKPSS